MNNEFFVFEEELYNGETHQKVIGIRIMITGVFKELLDKQMITSRYNNYSDIIGEKLKLGIEEIINESNP